MNRPVSFIRRGSYSGITDLLLQGKLDFAWVCGYPYVRHADQMRLLAVPVYQGRPLYQSYIIVPASDKSSRRFQDLRGRIFAYSDPDSNSGYLYPQSLLADARETGDVFFGRSFFTWGHPRVVEAVAVGLADAGAVDGYVWETMAVRRPELTARTRILDKSPWFGFPPFVARKNVPEADFAAMQRVLAEMDRDPEGRLLLKELNLDGFAPGDAAIFDGIRHNMTKVHANQILQSARPQPAP
jgi:phosphonate transport system substrate-binding protein